MTLAANVWNTLSRIDVVPFVEHIRIESGRSLSYVPWHKAWMLVKRIFPGATYCHGEDIVHPDGTMEVEVYVHFHGDSDDPDMFRTYARLPVMDNKYRSIPNPNARDINDSRQRCLVKALAFAGLGLSLWDAGSTVPVGTLTDPITDAQRTTLMNLIEASGADVDNFYRWAEISEVSELPQEKYQSAVALLKAKLAKKEAQE